MNDIVTLPPPPPTKNELRTTKGHNIVKDIMNNTMNDIVNDKKGQNIVNDSFAHEPDRLFVLFDFV